MRRQLITAVTTLCLIGAVTATSRAESLWQQLINLANQLKATSTHEVLVANNTGRIAKFKVKRGDGTFVASSGPVAPWSVSPAMGKLPNPNRYNVKAYVLNECTGRWVEKTSWTRFVNPGHDLLLEFYQPAGGGFDLDWFVP